MRAVDKDPGCHARAVGRFLVLVEIKGTGAKHDEARLGPARLFSIEPAQAAVGRDDHAEKRVIRSALRESH